MDTTVDNSKDTHDAFISYSRKNRDFAVRLEKALEGYVPPKDLSVPQRHLDIFRDETDFTGVEYHHALDTHLQSSAKLIVICSPDARKSLYVNDEIRRFAVTKGAGNIVPILVAGIPNNEARPGQEAEQAFPDALCDVMEIPLAQNYLNFNGSRDKINKGAFDGAWYATLANLYGVSRSVIEERDRRRRAHRRRLTAIVLTGFITALLVALVVTLMSRHDAVTRLAELYEEQGRRELSNGKPEQALAFLNEALSIGADRTSLHYLIARAARPLGVPRVSLDAQSEIRDATFSADDKLVLTGGMKGTIQVWDARTGSVLFSVGSDDSEGIESATFSPDGGSILTVSRKGKAKLRRVGDWKAQTAIGDPEGGVRSARFSTNGARVLTVGPGARLEVWDSDGGKRVVSLEGHTGDIGSACFSADGGTIAATAGGQIFIWDAQGGTLLRSFAGPNDPVTSVVFSREGSRILTVAANGAQLWDSATGQRVVELGGFRGSIVVQAQMNFDGTHLFARTENGGLLLWDAVNGNLAPPESEHGWVLCAAFSPDGKRIGLGTESGWAGVLDAATGKPVVSLVGHTLRVHTIAFSNDGKRVVTGSGDRTGRIWDAGRGQPITILVGHRDDLTSVAFSSGGKECLTVGAGESAKLWDVPADDLLLSWQASANNKIRAAAFSPDSNQIVSAGENTARVWNAKSGQLVASLEGHEKIVNAAVFSADGQHVITGSYDETVRFWEVKAAKNGKILRATGHGWQVPGPAPGKHRVVGVGQDWMVRTWDLEGTAPPVEFRIPTERREVTALSHDGQFVAAVDPEETMNIWRIANGQSIAALKGDTEHLRQAIFSPSGDRMLLIRENTVVRAYRTAKIWDISRRRPLVSLEEGVDDMEDASFSGDGNRVVSGHWDGSVRIWDAGSGSLLASLSASGSPVSAVSFSPDSERVLAGRTDGTLQVWDVRLDRRTREQLGNFVKQRVAFELRNGRLLPIVTAAVAAKTAQRP